MKKFLVVFGISIIALQSCFTGINRGSSSTVYYYNVIPEDNSARKESQPFGFEKTRLWATSGGFDDEKAEQCWWHFEVIMPEHMKNEYMNGEYHGSRSDILHGDTFSFEDESFTVYYTIHYHSEGYMGERNSAEKAEFGYIKSITKLDEEANRLKVTIYDDISFKTYTYIFAKLDD